MNSKNFSDMLSDSLELEKYKKEDLYVNNQMICETPDYIYELFYIDKLKEGDINGIGNLLSVNGEEIYGNVILIKTFISKKEDSMYMIDCNNKDVFDILRQRAFTKIVTFDGEWKETEWLGNMKKFADEFFDDTYLSFELPFLKHNINIYYETCNGCSYETCGNIIFKPIYKCIWFTMITDVHRGNISLEEVLKIVQLSKKMEEPYKYIQEKETNDKFGRKVNKNKYRVLEEYFEKLFNTIK